MQAGDTDAIARASLLYFCLFHIGFVVAASSLFTFRESARYRYQVESMMWLMTTLCVVDCWRVLRDRVRVRGSRE